MLWWFLGGMVAGAFLMVVVVISLLPDPRKLDDAAKNLDERITRMENRRNRGA